MVKLGNERCEKGVIEMKEQGGEEIKEKSYQAVFRSHLIACAIIDNKGVIKKITKAMVERFAISMEEIKGQSLLHILDSDTLTEFVNSHIKECEKRKTVQSESALVAIKGRKARYLWNQVEITSLGGEDGYLLIFHDCTESYQAQMILESSLALSKEVFLFFDNRNCLLQCSEEAVRIFGFPNRIEALGMHYTTFFHNCLSEELLNELFQTLEEGKSFLRAVSVKYKGAYESYELEAFNVMVKHLKSGMAVCLHKKEEGETYLLMEQNNSYDYRKQTELSECEEDDFEEWEEKEKEEVWNDLRESLENFHYVQAEEITRYLLREASSQERVFLEELRKELLMFRYEKAISLLEVYIEWKKEGLNRGEA